MLDTIQFAEEMKRVLGLPASHNVDIEKPICKLSTDEVLSPNGFDLRIGKQVFYFNMRKNSNLIYDLQRKLSIAGVPKQISDEVYAVVNCEKNYFKGFRHILEKGYSQSRLCRYYFALDLFTGRDGNKDKERAYKLLTDTPWGGKDNNLSWIKDISHRQKAANMCIDFCSQETISWNGNTITNYSKAFPFLELLANIGGHFDNPTRLNNYGVYLWETSKSRNGLQCYDAFRFFPSL